MAARSGSEFLERLSAARIRVEIQGETLTGGVADHPAFRNVVRSYAELYDMQHDPAFRDILTYPSPATGEPVATSFLQPRTHDDLTKRRQAFKAWADHSLGMLGRTGDYLNSALMALASRNAGSARPAPDSARTSGATTRKSARRTCSAVTGSAAADVETYLQSATLGGADRVRLFRLVWDTCISAFSGRQALYEYYFFGDPVRMAGAYVASYDREPYKADIQAFLDGT